MYLGEFPLIFFNMFLDPVCLLLFEILLQFFGSSIQFDLPPCILHWICAFDFTHNLRNAHFMGELLLYWPSQFFTHFGNRCQWGRDLEGLRELVFCSLASMLFVVQGCLIHYINPRKRDCHQLPKWGRLKGHVLPYLWFW